ncbi:hypothetical protein GCM10008922_20760 [Faecalicatena contorta]|uniref:AraC family transcriptional regulator n=1 Tax=Faecalicatena contorta TaxID=39482 RepID=UPI0031D69DE3
MKKNMQKSVKIEGKRNKLILRKIEQKQTFRRILLTIAIAMLLAVILCFAIMYNVVKKIIMEQNIESSQQQFVQIQEEFEVVNEQVNMIATQVILDDVCSDWLLASRDRQFNSLDIARIRKQLTVFKNTNNMISSIYIYNGNLDKFLSTGAIQVYSSAKHFSDQGIVEILNDYEDYYSRNLFKRTLDSGSSSGEGSEESVYTYILNNTQNRQITSAIVVNLDLRLLFTQVLGMDAMKESQMAIVDDKGKVWAELQNISNLDTEIIKSPVFDKIDGEEGYTEAEYNGERYFVSWIHSDKTDWDYLKITKWDTVFKRLLELQKWTFFICAVIVIAVASGSLLSTVSIYRLYGQLERKNFIKNRVVISDNVKLREEFLSEFLHKKRVYGKEELLKKFEHFGFTVKDGQVFTIVLLQLEEYSKFIEEYGREGTYDIKYGFRNIFAEVFNEEFRVQGVINPDNTIVFSLTSKEWEPVSQEKIEQKFQEFCEKVRPFADWKFFLSGSESFVPIEEVPDLAEKLYQIKGESFFYPSNQYRTYEKMLEEHHGSVNYRKMDIGKLTETMRSGADILEQYQAFAKSLEGCASSEYMNAMVWLGVSVVRSLKEFYMTVAEDENVFNDFLAQLAKCEKKAHLDKLFEDIFIKIIQIQERANVKKGVSKKVEEIQEYIRINYSNMNIALEYLGDEFGVSANYLGRVFKKETGVSVSEFLNNVRLEKVLELLEQTDRPAKDIAEECGFASTNYFYTYFRKRMGVTPQIYRQKKRS